MPDLFPPTLRPRWRPWLQGALAVLGLLALVWAGLAVLNARRADRPRAAAPGSDAVINEHMDRHYGKYSAEHKGWLYVNPDTHQTYLMRVIQSARVARKAGGGMPAHSALYFLASGVPLDGDGLNAGIVGAFVLTPDPQAENGAPQEAAEPYHPVQGMGPLRPEDVRLEALSLQSFGWVLRLTLGSQAAPAARFVVNLVLAPHGGRIVEVARFPAQASYTPAEGCEAAAVAGEDDPGYDEEEEPPGTTMCSDAAWTYQTGELPGDGLVVLTVSGGGRVNGSDIPQKTHRLMFDPKRFSYVVPDELRLF